MSVRRRVDGGLTDVVSHLLAASEGSLTVLRRDGEVVFLDPAAVTAAKIVPPRTGPHLVGGARCLAGRHAADVLGRLASLVARRARRLGAPRP